MKKAFLIVLVVSIALVGILGLAVTRTSYARSMLITDVNNKYDPVDGTLITVKRFRTDYAGKRYWFNSYRNIQAFKQDPEKYLRNLGKPASSTPTPARSNSGY